MAATDQENIAKTFLSQHLENTDYVLIPLAGDASARKYSRVISGDDSFVLMLWEPFVNDGNYPFLSVQEHFARHDVHVPKVYGLSPKDGLVLLEDLGDLTLERKFWETQNQSSVLPFYKAAINELIKIHYLCSQDRKPCTAFQVEFDTKKFLWEMNYGREHLLEGLCQLRLTEQEKSVLTKCFVDICENLHKEPKLICHRDFHSRNLMIKLGNLRVIDFQDARLGPVQYDLVSLICDSYVDLKPESQEEILKYYLEAAAEHQTNECDLTHFHHVFSLQLIQRCFKACGSFASFYNLRGDRRYLKYINKTVARVTNELKKFPQYKDFYSVIVDRGLIEYDYEVFS